MYTDQNERERIFLSNLHSLWTDSRGCVAAAARASVSLVSYWPQPQQRTAPPAYIHTRQEVDSKKSTKATNTYSTHVFAGFDRWGLGTGEVSDIAKDILADHSAAKLSSVEVC